MEGYNEFHGAIQTSHTVVMEEYEEFRGTIQTPTFFLKWREGKHESGSWEVYAELYGQMEFLDMYTAVAESESGCCN